MSTHKLISLPLFLPSLLLFVSFCSRKSQSIRTRTPGRPFAVLFFRTTLLQYLNVKTRGLIKGPSFVGLIQIITTCVTDGSPSPHTELRSQAGQKGLGLADVFLLLGGIMRDLALDGQRASVAEVLEGLEVGFHTDIAVAECDFAAP